MRFRVDRNALADAVAWTARTLPIRPPVPILAGLSLEVGERLKLSSFDYDVSSQVEVDIDVEEAGGALVSGRLLAEIARNLPQRPVEIAADASRVEIACGTARFGLLKMPSEDYPTLPEMPPIAGLVGGDVFRTAVRQVTVAASREDTVPLLTGVRIEIQGDTVTLVSTDRYRIAVREFRWNSAQADVSATALVPARSLADTVKNLSSSDPVAIALAADDAGEGIIGFESAGRRATMRLIAGEFIKYQAHVPGEFVSRVQVSTEAFAEALKRMSLVAERNTPIRILFSQGQAVLEAGTGDDADATETLEAKIDGEDIQIAFNSQFLLEGLVAIDSETVYMHFTSPTGKALVTGRSIEGSSVPDYRYVVMPVRLSR